jgi:hypothetical protein
MTEGRAGSSTGNPAPDPVPDPKTGDTIKKIPGVPIGYTFC